MLEYISTITQLGFSVFVAVWLLIRQREVTEAIKKNAITQHLLSQSIESLKTTLEIGIFRNNRK